MCVEKAGSIQGKITSLITEIVSFFKNIILMVNSDIRKRIRAIDVKNLTFFATLELRRLKFFCFSVALFVFRRTIWVQQYIVETKRQVGPLGKMFKSIGNATNVAKRIQVYLVATQTASFQEAHMKHVPLWSLKYKDFFEGSVGVYQNRNGISGVQTFWVKITSRTLNTELLKAWIPVSVQMF